MALVKPPEWKIEQLFRGCPLVVVLDGLQDPGNAGAILRAAEAFGATGRCSSRAR
jgi:RNA methyltransferase, TrmH family